MTYSDGPVVNEETIQLLVSLAGAIGVMEHNVGDTTAASSRSVYELGLLDSRDSCLEVLLNKEKKKRQQNNAVKVRVRRAISRHP